MAHECLHGMCRQVKPNVLCVDKWIVWATGKKQEIKIDQIALALVFDRRHKLDGGSIITHDSITYDLLFHCFWSSLMIRRTKQLCSGNSVANWTQRRIRELWHSLHEGLNRHSSHEKVVIFILVSNDGCENIWACYQVLYSHYPADDPPM